MGKSLKITALRKQLYRVVDRVLETGVPAELERNGRRLLIVPEGAAPSKLARLRKRKGIRGDPDDLVKVKAGEWDELKNLR